jgi:hypothetical protein
MEFFLIFLFIFQAIPKVSNHKRKTKGNSKILQNVLMIPLKSLIKLINNEKLKEN